MQESVSCKNNLVTVVMPAYNAGKTLDRSVQSVLEQTYKDIELIIVNDCSTDDTSNIISKYNHLSNVIAFENNSNQGVSGSRNVALKNASGRYISFLDADDYWEKSKIEKQVKFMKNNNIGICFTGYWRVKGSLKKRVKPILKVTRKKLLIRNHIPNLTAMYDRKKVPLIYQMDIPHEDYVMWYDLLKHSDAYCFDEPLASYTVSPDSLSGNKFKAVVWNYHVKRNVFGLGTFKSITTTLLYILYSLRLRLLG